MSKPLIIGIAGPIGSGKSTAADFLKRLLGAEERNFADPLKAAAAILFDVPIEKFNTQGGKAEFNEFWGMTHREMLQKLGTEAMRHGVRGDFWGKRLERSLLHSKSTCVIIGDVRFLNEAQFIYDQGGFLVHIVRPNNPHLTIEAAAHASEQTLPVKKGDYAIRNNASKAFLRCELFKIVMHNDEAYELLAKI